MKIKLFSLAALFVSTAIFTSCEMDDPEVEVTPALPVSGEWYVKYEVQNAAGVWEDEGNGYHSIITSNTSDNATDKMWIGDIFSDPRAIDFTGAATQGTFWTYMVKANVDMGAKTFSVTDKSIAVEAPKPPTPTKPAVPATPYDILVTITDGKIITGGSTPPSGATTDSIHFKLQLEDYPGNPVFRVSGYKRTGFLEDEH